VDGATYIVQSLRSEGVDHLFMVPGGMNDPFMPAMTADGVRTVVAAHEGGAAYMADGYARASGRLGVAFGIGGPGVFNMATALAAARVDRSAVLVISGEVPTDREGRGGFQDASGAALDDVSVLKPITAESLGVVSPRLLGAELRTAALTALRDGFPVHLSVPLDIQRAEIDATWTPLPQAAYQPQFVDEVALGEALEVFRGNPDAAAANVVILAGIGVRRAGAESALIAVAERFEIPVATTLPAKGVMPEDHPLALGVFGYGGSRWATEAILHPGVEVLLVVGSPLSQRDTLNWDPQMLPSAELIQIDADPSLIGRTWPASVPVTASPKAVLERLADADEGVAAGLEAGRERRRAFLADVQSRGPRTYANDDMHSDAIPMHPARMVVQARAACPRDTVLAVDSGAHRAWCSQYWPSYGDNDYLSLANLAPMGGAIPLGIGAKLARPDRPVVVATGDGCMLMHGMEIHTAARHQVPVVILVFDNRSYGNIWYRAHALGPGPEALTDIPGIDWAAFARSLGGDGVTIDRPEQVADAFQQGFGYPGPFVIAARIDKRYPTPIAPWRQAVAEWEDHH
jgi:acetolactate synthase I/II/III large subunit